MWGRGVHKSNSPPFDSTLLHLWFALVWWWVLLGSLISLTAPLVVRNPAAIIRTIITGSIQWTCKVCLWSRQRRLKSVLATVRCWWLISTTTNNISMGLDQTPIIRSFFLMFVVTVGIISQAKMLNSFAILIVGTYVYLLCPLHTTGWSLALLLELEGKSSRAQSRISSSKVF